MGTNSNIDLHAWRHVVTQQFTNFTDGLSPIGRLFHDTSNNDLAVCGGTASGTGDQFLTPSDSAVLEAELSSIAISTISVGIDDCAITLDPAPEDPDLVHMVVHEAATAQWFDVPHERSPGDGWTISPDGTLVEMTGALCDEARSGRFLTVKFEYGCVEYPPLE